MYMYVCMCIYIYIYMYVYIYIYNRRVARWPRNKQNNNKTTQTNKNHTKQLNQQDKRTDNLIMQTVTHKL